MLSFFMVGVLGTGLTNVILPLRCRTGPGTPEVVRNLGGFLRQREFILAARLSGASQWRLFSDHLAGAVIPSLLVLAFAGYRPYDASRSRGMSFLGLGVSADGGMGVMINDARQYIWTQPLQMVWPGLALFISVMALTCWATRCAIVSIPT
ncbi:hypothetical protein LN650_03200 [Klebsiella pneumoniae subsp. pneumoniae]|nr:hypothetical protein [Klebsiella pneumoniae subsp. pneumoniae]